jgi:hypothetical protein
MVEFEPIYRLSNPKVFSSQDFKDPAYEKTTGT